METHCLFPFVEQSLGQSALCRRAQQRWCLLTLSHGHDCGTQEADVLCCSLLLWLPVPELSGCSHWPQFFSVPYPFPLTATPAVSDTMMLWQHCCFSFIHCAQLAPSLLPLPQKAGGESSNIHSSNPLHVDLFAKKIYLLYLLVLVTGRNGLQSWNCAILK